MEYEVLTPKKRLTASSTLSTFLKVVALHDATKEYIWGLITTLNNYLARLLNIGESENNCDKLSILLHSTYQKQLSFH